MSRADRKLSKDARALIEAGRTLDAPSAGDRERVRRALAVALVASGGAASASLATTGAKALAASAGSTTTTSAAGATTIGVGTAGATVAASATGTTLATAATAGVLTKVAIAVVALGIGSGAIVVAHHVARSRTETAAADRDLPALGSEIGTARESASTPHGGAPTVPSEATPTEASPSEVPPTEAPPTEATEAPPTDTAPAGEATASSRTRVSPARPARHPMPAAAATPRAEPSVDSASVDVSTIELENQMLRDAVAHGTSPERRLASVDAHARRFPDGQLASLRETARRTAVRDLCARGHEAVVRYLAASPTGVSADLVRQSCAP